MSPVNRSGTDSLDSLWPAKQKLIGTPLLSKDIGKISVHIGAAEPRERQAIGPGLVHVRWVTYDPVSEAMELNMLYWETTAGSNGNILEMLPGAQAPNVQHWHTGPQAKTDPRKHPNGAQKTLDLSGEKSAHHISKRSYLR